MDKSETFSPAAARIHTVLLLLPEERIPRSINGDVRVILGVHHKYLAYTYVVHLVRSNVKRRGAPSHCSDLNFKFSTYPLPCFIFIAHAAAV